MTEFLPVSSTGHLIVAQRALGIPESEAADSYAIAIQSGAILAVLVLYWRRLLQIGKGLVGRDDHGLRLGLAVAVAFLPAGVAGLLFHGTIERVLFGVWPVVIAWTVGAIAILALGDRLRPPEAAGPSPRSTCVRRSRSGSSNVSPSGQGRAAASSRSSAESSSG